MYSLNMTTDHARIRSVRRPRSIRETTGRLVIYNRRMHVTIIRRPPSGHGRARNSAQWISGNPQAADNRVQRFYGRFIQSPAHYTQSGEYSPVTNASVPPPPSPRTLYDHGKHSTWIQRLEIDRCLFCSVVLFTANKAAIHADVYKRLTSEPILRG